MRRAVIEIGMGLAILLSGCGVSSSVHQAALKDLAAARSDLVRLRDENATLKSEVAARQGVIQDLRQQIKEGENKGQMQSQDADRLVKRNLELVGEVANLSSQNRDLSQTLEDRDQELQQVRTRIAEKEKAQEKAKEEKTNRFKLTYDKWVGGFQDEIKKGEISVTQERDKLSVNLIEKTLFKSGSAEIKPTGLKLLDRIGEILKSDTDQPIRIEGYTDNVPIGSHRTDKFPTNWELSAARAINVVRYLSGPVGIPSERLSAIAFADNHPIASNETKEGRAQNRRIEIVLLPLDAGQGLQELKSPSRSP